MVLKKSVIYRWCFRFIGVSFRLAAVALLLSLLAAAPSFGQGAYTYADVYMSDAMVPEGAIYEEGDARSGPYIYGFGVTDSAYSSYGHQVNVNATLTSPNGHTTSAYASDPYYGYARAETAQLWDIHNLGTFNVRTSHYDYCSMRGYGYTSYLGPVGLWVGASLNVMRRNAPGSNAFTRITPCNVFCNVYGYIGRTSAFAYAYLFVPHTQFRCFRGSFVLLSDVPAECGDIYYLF